MIVNNLNIERVVIDEPKQQTPLVINQTARASRPQAGTVQRRQPQILNAGRSMKLPQPHSQPALTIP
jgi:hypothetical protein